MTSVWGQGQDAAIRAWEENARTLSETGLYDPSEEHDACGVGLIASVDGSPRRDVVQAGIDALKAVWHRGAIDADGKTGDGAGIHVEIPQDFFHEHIAAAGHKPGPERVAVGMMFLPRTDLEQHPESVAAMIKILDRLGVDYTFRSDALIAENYGYYAGSRGLQRRITRRITDAAKNLGASLVIVPECGHAYTALRWQAAEILGEELPFRVRHITEFLAEQLEAGKLKLSKVNGETFAFHDPCQIVRKGGVIEAPRQLMEAMGVDLKEMHNKKGFSFCCGGGGGVNDLDSARKLRNRAQELKLREIDDTGAKRFLTSCSDCRVSFEEAAEKHEWNKKTESLVELVATQIKE